MSDPTPTAEKDAWDCDHHPEWADRLNVCHHPSHAQAESDAPWCPECGPTCSLHGTVENDVPLTIEQIEALVEEVIDANSAWPDPLPSQVSAVMDIVRGAMEQAWEECKHAYFRTNEHPVRNPYARPIPPGETAP